MRMSRTDKDRPLWVQNAEHGHIDHDHSTGECIVSNDQRDRWPAWKHHWTKCKKRVRVEYECHPEKVNGKRELVFPTGIEAKPSTDACWVWTCDCPHTEARDRYYVLRRTYEDGSWMHGQFCENRYFVKCRGHAMTQRDDSIPCSCDDMPESATCIPAWDIGRYYTWGGVPSWYVSAEYHRPERARERDVLHDYAREYNAYGDLEDGDFINRQGRNSCRWTWW